MKITIAINVEFDDCPTDTFDKHTVQTVQRMIDYSVALLRGNLGPDIELTFNETYRKLMKGDPI